MATHPDVTAKMRAEVLNICGDQVPTYESIKQMKYGTRPSLGKYSQALITPIQ